MKLFEKNVGKTDKIIRIIAGLLVMAASYAYVAPPLSYLGLLIGLVVFATGVFGTCGFYSLFGINTNK